MLRAPIMTTKFRGSYFLSVCAECILYTASRIRDSDLMSRIATGESSLPSSKLKTCLIFAFVTTKTLEHQIVRHQGSSMPMHASYIPVEPTNVAHARGRESQTVYLIEPHC